MEEIALRPQQGRQEAFLSTRADIAIYGGAAGGGKTYALLLEPLRHMQRRGFTATCFRRTYPQITSQGGLWAESTNLYPMTGATSSGLTWTWPSGASLSFRHMETEADKYEYQGSQICLEMFDQLEQFTEGMFFFMMSRNRSVCGVKPYVRATANPQTGWLANFIAWWLDEDGYARPDRIGVLRYMTRNGDHVIWGDTVEEIREQTGDPEADPKTVTFIPASVYDNPALLSKDPTYIASLKALPTVDRMRLLGDAKKGGNWKIKVEGGFIKREWFKIVGAAPVGGTKVRGWDLAATKKKTADWMVGTPVTRHEGVFYVEQPVREKRLPSEVIKLMRHTAELDGPNVQQAVEQEGGSSGKIACAAIISALVGYPVRGVPASGDKVTRAMPFLTQAEAGNVRLVGEPNAQWMKDWLDEFCSFPEGEHDDQVDSVAHAFNYLTHGVIEPTGPAEDEKAPPGDGWVDSEAVWQ